MVAEESTLQKERSIDCDVRAAGEGHKGRTEKESTFRIFRLEPTGTRPGGERTGVNRQLRIRRHCRPHFNSKILPITFILTRILTSFSFFVGLYKGLGVTAMVAKAPGAAETPSSQVFFEGQKY